MSEQPEPTFVPVDEVRPQETAAPAVTEPAPVPQAVEASEGEHPGPGANGWHARAGREGARRVHQLIQEGRLYEQEHGLKRGRQRLRQLIELGKLYEEEHGLRPVRARTGRERLSRAGREELLATLVECLARIAKPSFRADLERLLEALPKEENGHAA